MAETIRIGFVALTDCAPLVVAHEAGFFRDRGLNVELSRQPSWESAERRLIDGSIQACHALGTFPLRSSLALTDRPAPICTAWVLARGGNAITVSNALWKIIQSAPDASATASLAALIPLRVGVVHRHAPHEYHLREWLKQQGLDPDEHAQWVVIPPQEMVGRLRDGMLEAFCAGEPWNQRAASSKLGAIAALGQDLLPDRSEKVLAVRRDWHRSHTESHAAILRALRDACRYLSDDRNLPEAARWLGSDPYVNSVEDLILADLRGNLDAGFRRQIASPDFLRFSGGHLNVPRLADADAWMETLTYWGHCPPTLLDADLSGIHLEKFHHESMLN